MKKMLDNIPTAGKNKNHNTIFDEQFRPKTQPTTEFVFEIRQLEQPFIQMIGARTGHYFQKNDQDWYRDVESKIQHEPTTTSSYIPSWVDRFSVASQVSFQNDYQGLVEEPPIQKPSNLLKEFNISEKIKQEKIQQETKRQSIGRVLTDSIINDIQAYNQQSSFSSLQIDSARKFSQENINSSKDLIQADASIYQMLENLPFQTPSKMSEFSGAFSRSKAQITFNLDISPILNDATMTKEQNQLKNLFTIKNLPFLDLQQDLKDQAFEDFFAQKSTNQKSIVILTKNKPKIYLYDSVLGEKTNSSNTQIIDDGPLNKMIKNSSKENIKKPRKQRSKKKQRVTTEFPITNMPNSHDSTSLNQEQTVFQESPQFMKDSQQQNQPQQENINSETLYQLFTETQAVNFTFQEEMHPNKRRNIKDTIILKSEVDNLNFVDQILDEEEKIQPSKKKGKPKKPTKKTKKLSKKQQQMLSAHTVTSQQNTAVKEMDLYKYWSNLEKYQHTALTVKKVKERFVETQDHDQCLTLLKQKALYRINMTSKQAKLEIKINNSEKFIFQARVLGNQFLSFFVRKGLKIRMMNFNHLQQVKVQIGKNHFQEFYEVEVNGGQKFMILNCEPESVKFKFQIMTIQ